MRLAMSPAAVGLLRGIIARSGAPKDRILLSEWKSVDWQSLTFIGERHEASLRICEPGAEAATRKILAGLKHAEFSIPGHLVADVALVGQPEAQPDGSRILRIEALTIAE